MKRQPFSIYYEKFALTPIWALDRSCLVLESSFSRMPSRARRPDSFCRAVARAVGRAVEGAWLELNATRSNHPRILACTAPTSFAYLPLLCFNESVTLTS